LPEPSAPGGWIPDEKVRRRCAALARAGSLDGYDPRVGTGQADADGGGDRIRIQIRVEDETVREARFKAFGCSSSIAAASVVAEWLEGRSLAAALEIRSADIAAELDLPAARLASARLAERAARAAVADFREKQERERLEPAASTAGRRPPASERAVPETEASLRSPRRQ